MLRYIRYLQNSLEIAAPLTEFVRNVGRECGGDLSRTLGPENREARAGSPDTASEQAKLPERARIADLPIDACLAPGITDGFQNPVGLA
jgi:hypothetical protein